MVALHLARGTAPRPRTFVPALPSPLLDVEPAAWGRFVAALATRDWGDVSESNGLGCFEMRPRRLAELGWMINLRPACVGGRQVWEGDFTTPPGFGWRFAEEPLTREGFLASHDLQIEALRASSLAYDADRIERPAELTRSGALAVLHVAGVGGLRSWEKRRFERTVAVVRRADGIF